MQKKKLSKKREHKLALALAVSLAASAGLPMSAAFAANITVGAGQTEVTGTSVDGGGNVGTFVTMTNNPADNRLIFDTKKPDLTTFSYNQVTLGKNAVWRPMDWSNTNTRTVITVEQLNTANDAIIDLAWRNISENASYLSSKTYTAATFNPGSGARRYARTMYIENASLGEGTTFKLNLYGTTSPPSGDNPMPIVSNHPLYDSVYIENATTTAVSTNIYIQLGWVNPMNEQATIVSGSGVFQPGMAYVDIPVLLGIANGGENLTVTGQGSFSDGVFSKFYIIPEIAKYESVDETSATYNFFTDAGSTAGLVGATAWYLSGYTFYNAGVSESGMSAGDASTVMANLWRSSYTDMFKRTGNLHKLAYNRRLREDIRKNAKFLNDGDRFWRTEDEHKENVWAEVWHGKFKSASGYGRSVDQNYNGMMLGYDKLLRNSVLDGRMYAGVYVAKQEGRSGMLTGSGKQDVKSIGTYLTWISDTGHYVDLGAQAAKLHNSLSFYDSNGHITGEHDTWSWALGAQYGYRHEIGRWFVEPQVALYYGNMNSYSYEMSNALQIHQGTSKAFTGKLGLSVGKSFEGRGDVYAKAAILRDFRDRARVSMTYGSLTDQLDIPNGKDTWYELGLGGNIRMSSNSNFNFDFTRMVGSDIGNEWRVNGMFEWTWGGASEKEKEAFRKAHRNQDENIAVQQTSTASINAQNNAVQAKDASGNNVVVQSYDAQNGNPGDNSSVNDLSSYTLEPITVEAARPEWEKNLSPGSVSVIYPQEFKGEQKNLPDLLERVPGLFIQRINGVGHYTVARVRASTAAQVNVYVDGVLMNLNGEAAVNLSTIPVENVERVEVYRGYVPARFSASPIGGVINIVTKRPTKAGYYVSQGMRSHGGYRGSYEYTAPLGKGSLMVGYNHDTWDGDFPFKALRRLSFGSDTVKINRSGNDYTNNDAIIKWQDENWMAKFSWKKNKEALPYTLGYQPLYQSALDVYNSGERNKYLKNEQIELQVGRRDTVGNLDWGWRVNYLKADKKYRWPYAMAGNSPWLTPAPGDAWSDYTSKKWGGNLNAAMRFGNSHLVEANFDYSHETLDANGSDWDRWNSLGWAQLQGRQYLRNYKIKEYHFSLQDTITLDSKGSLKLTPVVRADKVEMSSMSDNDHSWKYSAGVGLRKDIGNAWTIKTTYGTYNRHPNFYEIFGDGGNIRPNTGLANAWDLANIGTWETGKQFDISINWKGKTLGAKSDIIVTYFKRNADNELVLSVPPMQGAAASYLALSGTKARGVEIGTNLSWKRVNFGLTATYTKAEYDGVVTPNMRKGSRLPWIPKWVMSARLDYTLPGDKLNLFAEYYYTGEQLMEFNANPAFKRSVDSLGTINLGAKYSFGKGFKLSMGVNDVFNKGYKQTALYRDPSTYDKFYPLYPQPGRIYYATVEYKF